MDIVTILLFIKYIERKPILFQLFPIHEYLLIILWWFWFLVPRSCARINMVLELTAERRTISQEQDFWQISPWEVSNSSKFQHCTRCQGLPLNIPSKELVDQACLIDYAGCDESLKCACCSTLRCPFCCDFSGFWQVKAFAPADSDGFFRRYFDSIQFPLMERSHGDLAMLQRTLYNHHGH